MIVFIHVPKTAGTTLNAIFAHQYGPEATYKLMMRGMSWISPRWSLFPPRLISASNLRSFRRTLATNPQLRVVHGHFDMSLARYMPADAEYVTLLRDPVERAISHYNHYRKRADDPIQPLALSSTLAQWVGERRIVEMDNGQTRRLAGEMGLPFGRVTAETLAKAKANLKKFALVGLSERFSEFQILMHQRYQWPYFRYGDQNVGKNRPKREEIHPDELAVVEAWNRFDRELYDFAAQLFEQALSRIDLDRERQLLAAAPEQRD